MVINKKLTILFIFLISGCSTGNKISDKNKPKTNLRINSYNSFNGTLNQKQKNEIAILSFSLLDTTYNWAGKKPDFGLDCSGLVSYVFQKSIGFSLIGAARHIVNSGIDIPIKHVSTNKLEAGDLVFFNTTGKSYSHVGIYIGEKKFLHASSGKKKVITSSLDNPYYKKRLERIKRI